MYLVGGGIGFRVQGWGLGFRGQQGDECRTY